MTGDIEVDREARDWERHGHALNASFPESFFISLSKALPSAPSHALLTIVPFHKPV
jgi:hypothetical protein